MADRVAHVVWAKPRRRIGAGVGLAVFVAAVALLVSGLSTASNAASTSRHAGKVHHAAPGGAGSGWQRPSSSRTSTPRSTALLGRMTVAEKFGQLEMAGPDGPNGISR